MVAAAKNSSSKHPGNTIAAVTVRTSYVEAVQIPPPPRGAHVVQAAPARLLEQAHYASPRASVVSTRSARREREYFVDGERSPRASYVPEHAGGGNVRHVVRDPRGSVRSVRSSGGGGGGGRRVSREKVVVVDSNGVGHGYGY